MLTQGEYFQKIGAACLVGGDSADQDDLVAWYSQMPFPEDFFGQGDHLFKGVGVLSDQDRSDPPQQVQSMVNIRM